LGRRLYVPTEEELRVWLIETSECMIPDDPELAVGLEIYQHYRPDGWCSYNRLLRAFGQPATPVGYRRLVQSLTGRYVRRFEDKIGKLAWSYIR